MKKYTEKETIKIIKEKVTKFIKPKENEYFDTKEIIEAIEDETYEYFRKTNKINEDTLRKAIIDAIYYAICITIKMRVINKIHNTIIPVGEEGNPMMICYDYKEDEIFYYDLFNEYPKDIPIVNIFEITYENNEAICKYCNNYNLCEEYNKYDSERFLKCYNEFIDNRIVYEEEWIEGVYQQLNSDEWDYDKLWG